MIEDLTSDQRILADFMSDISGRCYDAGWMINLEYVLWDALTSGPRKYGHDDISQEDIIHLKKYSEKTYSWIIFDDNTEETAIDIEDWKEKFKAKTKDNPKLLNG